MKEQTDTHRRCIGRCRKWKWLHEFPKVHARSGNEVRRWMCAECWSVHCAKRYSQLPPEVIDRHTAKRVKATKERRRKAMAERRDSAEFYLTQFRRWGWTSTRIAQEAQVKHETIQRIAQRGGEYLKITTVKKLRNAFMQEVART